MGHHRLGLPSDILELISCVVTIWSECVSLNEELLVSLLESEELHLVLGFPAASHLQVSLSLAQTLILGGLEIGPGNVVRTVVRLVKVLVHFVIALSDARA